MTERALRARRELTLQLFGSSLGELLALVTEAHRSCASTSLSTADVLSFVDKLTQLVAACRAVEVPLGHIAGSYDGIHTTTTGTLFHLARLSVTQLDITAFCCTSPHDSLPNRFRLGLRDLTDHTTARLIAAGWRLRAPILQPPQFNLSTLA